MIKLILILVIFLIIVTIEGVMSIVNLNTSIATLAGNVNLLIAQEAGSVPQADVDAAQVAVDAINTTVVGALAPKQ